MPKPKSRTPAIRVPKYRHQGARDLAVVRIDGHDHYLGRYESPESHDEYRRLVAEWVARGGVTPPSPATAEGAESAGLSVDEVILAYWRHAERHYRHPDGEPTGEVANIRDALRPLRRLYGSTPAVAFGPKHLKAVRGAMVDDGLARTTVNQRVGKLVRVFKWAASEELIPAAVYQSLRTVDGLRAGRTAAREKPPVGPVPDTLVDPILPFVSAPVRAMIELQRHTTARPGEVLIMRTADVDRSKEPWVYVPSRHKAAHHGKRRRIHLGPKARAILAPWLKDDAPEAFLFAPSDAVVERHARRTAARRSRPTPSEKSKRVGRPGQRHAERYDGRSYRQAIIRGCDRAFMSPTLGAIKARDLTPEQRSELKAWRKAHRWAPNQLRHSSATRVRREADLETARAVLGHARADTTEIYAERDFEKAAEVMERIG